MGMNGVAAAAQSLVGKVDALFVPNDATVYSVFESVVKVAQDAQMPLFSTERRSMQRGSIGTVGYNFVDMGITTARMIDKVLRGTTPGDFPGRRSQGPRHLPERQLREENGCHHPPPR